MEYKVEEYPIFKYNKLVKDAIIKVLTDHEYTTEEINQLKAERRL